MRIPYYSHQTIEQDDIDAVVAALRSEYLTQGPRVRDFEERLADYVGAKYAVAMCNGTAALHSACLVLGKERMTTTTLSFVATANAIVMAGGKPLLQDIGLSWNAFDSDLSVDFAGKPANRARLIEDACHALGAEIDGQKIGHRALMTCFSFHPVKVLTTEEGGAVTTDSEEYATKLRQIRDHGRINGECHFVGYNYRMGEMRAALGLSQLRQLPSFLDRRREIALRYCEAFGVPFVQGHAYHLFVILVDNRDEVKARLFEKGIQCQIHYKPIHLQPFYQQWYRMGDFPNAESYYERCLSLPIYPLLTDEQVRYVIESVQEVTDGH